MNAVETLTRRLLIDGGITTGMRVLDVGCGYGDVTRMVAELVGDAGQVIGVDHDERALETARMRAAEQGFSNVAFAPGDMVPSMPIDGLFDAVVGRRVLMYQGNPIDAIDRLLQVLRPGGRIVFQEHDSTLGPNSSLPLHQQVHGWIWETVAKEGGNINLGFNLHSVLTQGGAKVEQVRAEAIVQTPTQSHPIAFIVRAMMPRLIEHGVATDAEIEIETLELRLNEERQKANATFIWDMAFGVWGSKP
ncbi:class I SAM-dependent methyltransferase [bacterium]|nr:MAG: class I SAM-dependent methyltransferase [bacterium]